MAGEFEKLLPFFWQTLDDDGLDEVHLPLTRIHLSLAHDLVEHKYWGVDGGRVESTGVAPLRISATIPISNHIYPGKNEKWDAGKLYPTALRKLMRLFTKRTTGLVQHPEFGGFVCKAERLDFELTGDKRGATEIHASWVETLDDTTANQPAAESPAVALSAAAASLTASHAQLRGLVPKLPVFKDDLEGLGRKLSSVTDRVTVLSYRHAGLINRVMYQAHRMEVAIRRAKNALTWPALREIQIIRAAGHALLRQMLAPGGIGLYVVPTATTLAGVALALPKGTPIGTLIRLNPNLVRGPVVSKGATVRYRLAA